MRAYLAENIRVGVVLQEDCGGARVVISGGDVQSGEADLALGAVVNEQGYDVLVALLEGHCEGREAILRDEAKSREEGSQMIKRLNSVFCYTHKCS